MCDKREAIESLRRGVKDMGILRARTVNFFFSAIREKRSYGFFGWLEEVLCSRHASV